MVYTFIISTIHNVQIIYGGFVCPKMGVSVCVLHIQFLCF